MHVSRFAKKKLSVQSIRIMCDVLEELDIDPSPALARIGLRQADLENPLHEVSGLDELRFQEEFVELTRHAPGAWLRTGLRYRLLSYGPYGYAVISAQTIRRSIELAVAFQELTFTLLDYESIPRTDGMIEWLMNVEHTPEHLRAFSIERDLVAVTSTIRDIWQGKSPIRRIETTLPKPSYAALFEEILQAPVVFDAGITRWLIEPLDLDQPKPLGDPLLEQTYERQCRALIAQFSARDRLSDRVRDLLDRSPEKFPGIGKVARSLGMTERTLRRALAREATSFRNIVEDIRAREARMLLQSSSITIDQIAARLGYAETASFTHAFKRWTGMSPRSYRTYNASFTPGLTATTNAKLRRPLTARNGPHFS